MLTNQPLVTIILPVYNGEKTLKETVKSLVDQTFTNFELLVGIDGTNDNSENIAAAFKDHRIKIYKNETNLGLAANLNKLIALSAATSQYIAMAEQDDIYVPERIQWQVEVMGKDPKVGLVSGIAEFISESRTLLFPDLLVKGEQFPQGEALFKFLYINQLKVVNTCMMFKKEVHVNKSLKFNNTYGNFNTDWDYVLRFSLVSKIYGIPKKLVNMSRHAVNNSVTADKRSQHLASRNLLKDFKVEFPHLITTSEYHSALKMHRKIELGHHSKLGVILYSLYYFLLYFDTYFLSYAFMRIKKYFSS